MLIRINNHNVTVSWTKVLYFFVILFFVGYLTFDMSYNTAFVDEAIYATIGEEVLRKIYWEKAISWMGGSYLYPIVSAYFNRWNGLTGTRLFSTLCVLIAGTTAGEIGKQLGRQKVQVITTFIFLFSASSLSLGQLATYDTPSVALTALSFYFAMNSRYSKRKTKFARIIVSSILFVLAVLSKYIAIFFLPAIVLTLYDKSLTKTIRNTSLWLFPFVLIIGYYALINFDSLANFFTGSNFSEPTTRIQVLKEIIKHINIFIPGVAIGTYYALRKIKGEKRWLILTLAIGGLLPITYHLFTANIRSVWKHMVFTTFFWAPITGWAIYKLYTHIQAVKSRSSIVLNLSQLILTFYILTIISNLWFNFGQHWRFQRSWPSATPTLEYLEKYRKADDKIFAEASAVYKYHLFSGFEDPSSWSSTWWLEYEGLFGIEAMEKAINDKHFDYIILNNYFTNSLNQQIMPEIKNNYEVALIDTYKVSGKYEHVTKVWKPRR